MDAVWEVSLDGSLPNDILSRSFPMFTVIFTYLLLSLNDVITLSLVFDAAGTACLRSKKMKINVGL